MKPRIYRGSAAYPLHPGLTVWRCAGDMCNGQGETPYSAYYNWKAQWQSMAYYSRNVYPPSPLSEKHRVPQTLWERWFA
jgi:hypothetical protein